MASLALIHDALSYVRQTISAADRGLRATGVSATFFYYASRVLGVVLDALTIILSLHEDQKIIAYVYLAQLIIFRLPMPFLALSTSPSSSSSSPTHSIHSYVRPVKGDPNGRLAETFWRGSFFSLPARVQYVGSLDRVLVNRAAFFWLSLVAFAAMLALEVLFFALAFILQFAHHLQDSTKRRDKVPVNVSILLGVQGALMLGGIVVNFGSYHLRMVRREEILDALQQPAAPMPYAQAGSSAQPLLNPADAQLDELRQWFNRDDPALPCQGCMPTCSGECGGFLVDLSVKLGYVAFVLLTGAFLAVGIYFFWAFLEYY